MLLIVDFGSTELSVVIQDCHREGIEPMVRKHYQLDNIPEFHGLIIIGKPRGIVSEHINIVKELSEYVPVLGIGYGAQLLAELLTGRTVLLEKRSNPNQHEITLTARDTDILSSFPRNFPVNMTNRYRILGLSPEIITGYSTSGAIVAFEDEYKYGILADYDPSLRSMIRNFFDICSLEATELTVSNEFLDSLKADVIMCVTSQPKVLVTAVMLHKTIGSRLKCYLIDDGLLPKEEADWIINQMNSLGIEITLINFSSRFMTALISVTDSQFKKHIVKRMTLEILSELAHDHHCQLYHDGELKLSHGISSSKPWEMRCDYARRARELGLAVYEGPTKLTTRIIGEITRDKVDLLKTVSTLLWTHHIIMEAQLIPSWDHVEAYNILLTPNMPLSDELRPLVKEIRAVPQIDSVIYQWN